MKLFKILLISILIYGCKETTKSLEDTSTKLNEQIKDSTDISAISTKEFREFKVLDSKYLSNEEIWKDLNIQLEDFKEEQYNALKSLVLEQDIPTLQKFITEEKLSYESLTKFYLYRIRKFDRENELSLNSVIAVNPNVILEARVKDEMDDVEKDITNQVFGMPILLKDNINTSDLPTTAGAVALQNNITNDAFIVNNLKEAGALILGKANLSEWAYFFCGDCPSGYSAIGGQTLNPYGRKTIDTGGSSAGSGVAVSLNFCVAALGSETSGSILSPASQNSTVGLKPTIGLVSRSGIVPISSTLDTAGPITKNVIDNAIVLDAIFGFDDQDFKSITTKWGSGYYTGLNDETLKGKRFGAFKRLLEDSLYVKAIADLKSQGAEIIEIYEEKLELPNFIRLLNLDMQKDLPTYFSNYGNASLGYKKVEDVMAFNLIDSVNVMPYGQKLFKGIVEDSSSEEEFQKIKSTLKTNGKQFFEISMKAHNLDAVLSINNYHAGFAAVAEYPALTVPMGYTDKGVPKGLTFIGIPLSEKQLLQFALVYESASKQRIAPKYYD